MKKIVAFTIIVAFIFFTYLFFNNEKVNYVALGDSIAAGQNSYGQLGYGYTDYFKDYLDSKNMLNSYHNFSINGCRTEDLIDEINNNKTLKIKNTTQNIKQSLRESDIVTISIGANDFIRNLDSKKMDFTNIDKYLKKIDSTIINIDEVLKTVRKYAKKNIIVIGYYNPYPSLFLKNGRNIDILFEYLDRKYNEVCNNHNADYISIYEIFKNNSDYLPNPLDIHPNQYGYKAISDLLIKKYTNNYNK